MEPPAAPLALVADDDAGVRATIGLDLSIAGYRVVEAAHGVQALDLAGAATPDVVVLDLGMPVLDGFATLRRLKGDPQTRDVPVLVLTGSSEPTDLVRALGMGAHDYVRKPPDATELVARVAAAARLKYAQDSLRRHTEELEVASRTDFLTGLHNRRHLEEQLAVLVAAGRRHGQPVGVLIADVDHFKAVNDEAGHEAGDLVLREIAARLRGVLRMEDLLGRWGGEEFLVLAPMTDLAAVRCVAERLRAAVAGRPVRVADTEFSLSVSIGGSSGRCGGQLLTTADTNLFLAKRAGRNAVVVADPVEARVV